MQTRICLATDSQEPSGVGEHMLALARGLRERYDIVLACPGSPGGQALLRRAGAAGIGVKRLDDDRDDTRRWLRTAGFDLLHVHAGIGWEGHALAADGRAACVARVVRTEHLPDVITDPLQRLAHAEGLRSVDAIICVSAAAAGTFRASGVDAGTIAIIRNGHPDQRAGRSRASVRRAFGVGELSCVMLTVARLSAQKDHATLLDALPVVLARHPDTELWLAGSGPLEAALRRQVEALGIGRAVRFLGLRDDVPDLLSAADLFVLPSRFEGLPLAALEAMAAGLPVVATRVGGTDEAVRDGVTGILVEPGNARGLGDAAADLLADPERRHSFGAAGRARFLDVFTVARMADETAELYGSLGVAPRPEHRMDDMNSAQPARTRIAFIGAGGIAQRHLGVLETFEDVAIVGFADPVAERAQTAAERFGARAYVDPDVMLKETQPDAVYVCVPPFAHGAPEQAALARGIPFFVEKPVSLDLETAEAIDRAVREAGLITAVGYHWRYLDTVEEARALLADNPAQLLSGYWLDSTPPPEWWWKQDRSGGQMIEQTTHLIDLCRYLVGDVVQVFGLAGHKPRDAFPGLDVATASTASLKFASGAIANLGSTCLLGWNHRVGLHIFADRLAMELTDHDIMVDVGRGRPTRHAEGDPVWREDRDFIDAVRGGPNHIRCSYAEALATHRIAVAIGRSATSGQAITLTSRSAEPVHV